MHTLVDKSGTPEALERMLNEMDARPDVGSVFVLGAEANGWTKEIIDPMLTSAGKAVFGGIFPAVIHGLECMEVGGIAVGLSAVAKPHVITGMSAENADYEALLDDAVAENDALRTMLVLVDGLSTRISAFLQALYTVFGLEINYVGGGCGSRHLEKKPCLLTPGGMMRDAALLVELEAESGVGVSHGWRPMGAPFKATEVESNTIVSLDWQPAVDVCRKAVEAAVGERLTEADFFRRATHYPLGIAKMDAEMIVRDLFHQKNGTGIRLVGDVPAGAYMYVLTAEDEDLIDAAARAGEMARQSLFGSDRPRLCLLMDCISREVLLKDKFRLELEAIGGGRDLVGACSMGEIANTGKEFLEFYNKTAVVALLEDV